MHASDSPSHKGSGLERHSPERPCTWALQTCSLRWCTRRCLAPLTPYTREAGSSATRLYTLTPGLCMYCSSHLRLRRCLAPPTAALLSRTWCSAPLLRPSYSAHHSASRPDTPMLVACTRIGVGRRRMCCLGRWIRGRCCARSTRAALASTLAQATLWREATQWREAARVAA